MEPRKHNMTQTAIHVPQGEGKSVWILDELLTFKVHDQSQKVGIFEDEVLPESGPPAHLHRSQDETHYVLEGHFEFVIGERKVNAGAGSVVYVPRTTVRAFTNTGTQKGKRSCLSRRLQDRWSSSSKRPVSRSAIPLRPQ
jgi:mannose-6-phosphate isomerase-like protein (cupin superfamily)